MRNKFLSRSQQKSPTDSNAHPKQGSDGESIVKTIAKPIMLAIIAGIAGVITTVMTPLSDLASAIIWRPAPSVQIFPDTVAAKQGDLIRLDLFLYPMNKVPIPVGNLKVEYQQNLLQVGAETTSADLARVTPEIKTALKITGDKPLEFIANLPGEGFVSVSFKSVDGVSATSSAKILITPKEAVTRPTYDKNRKLWNITGKWRIILSGAPGEMAIVDEGGTVKGSYKLSDGNAGTVDGWHDGDSFNFYMSRGTDNPTQLWAKGPFGKGASTELQVDGELLLRSPSKESATGWTEQLYGNGQFSAKAEM